MAQRPAAEKNRLVVPPIAHPGSAPNVAGRRTPPRMHRAPSLQPSVSTSSVFSNATNERHSPEQRSAPVPTIAHVHDVKETTSVASRIDPVTGRKMINKYVIVRELGRGCHGKVKLCIDTETGDYWVGVARTVRDRGTRRFSRHALARTSY